MMRKNTGFTITELMVVIALFSVMAAIAIPGFSRWMPDYRLRRAAQNLQSAIQQARLAAIKESANVVLDFDPDGGGTVGGGYLAFVDNGEGGGAASNGIQDGTERTVIFGNILPELIANSDLAGLQATFNTRGLFAGLNNRGVYLQNQNNRFMGVRVNLTGNSRIVRSDDNGATWH